MDQRVETFMRRLQLMLLIIGLLLTAVGAWVAARAVMITDDQAKQLGTTKWESNADFIESLKAQSRAAHVGLYLIVAGTVLQIIGTIPAGALAALIDLARRSSVAGWKDDAR
jgi:hypothetical protein